MSLRRTPETELNESHPAENCKVGTGIAESAHAAN
jgi:hypothetical protein